MCNVPICSLVMYCENSGKQYQVDFHSFADLNQLFNVCIISGNLSLLHTSKSNFSAQ